MTVFHEVKWPVRVETDPYTPAGFRVYDDAGHLLVRHANGTIAAVEEGEQNRDVYTHFSDRAEAVKVRDAINAGWAP